MLEPRTVANAYVRTLIATAENCGAPAHELLHGLPLDLAAPGGRTDVTLVNRLWARALALTGEPGLGLKMARVVTPTTFRALGLAVMSCATLKDAIDILLRYQRLVSEAGTLSAHPRPDGGLDLTYTEQRMRFHLLPQQVEAILGGVVSQANWLAGKPLPPPAIRFRHEPQTAIEHYVHVFGSAPRFGADTNRLDLSPAFLATTLPQPDAELCRLHCDMADQELARLPQAGFVTSFALQWLASRSSGTLRIADLARTLGMSVRSLQRQLDSEGTSWTAVVDTARREALVALLQQGVALDDAAQRLGYHDASSLSRAARRWFGMPPGQWLAAQNASGTPPPPD